MGIFKTIFFDSPYSFNCWFKLLFLQKIPWVFYSNMRDNLQQLLLGFQCLQNLIFYGLVRIRLLFQNYGEEMENFLKQATSLVRLF